MMRGRGRLEMSVQSNVLWRMHQDGSQQQQTPKMSQFRIQRKLTEGSSIKLKPSLSNPQRIRSLQSKQSFTRSPKKLQQGQLRRMVKKLGPREQSGERTDYKEKSQHKERLQEGMRAFKEKNVVKALQIFKELRKSGDRSPEVSYYMGSCLLNLGKHQSSIVHLNECLLHNQRFNQNAYLYIAINFKLLGNIRQALKTLEKATSLFPHFEEGFFYTGKLAMKLAMWSQAIDAFSKSLQINPANDLATIFCGDCLKAIGKLDKASQKYSYVVLKGKKHREMAVGRLGSLLLEQKCDLELYGLLKELLSKGFEHPEVSYYMGISCWGLGNKNEAIVYLQSCLSSSSQASAAAKSLKALIRIAVEQGNFFQAEHHISRIQKLELNSQSFSEWKLFVQGANDLIKRKNQPALEKITQSLKLCDQKQHTGSSLQVQSFRSNAYPYAAYALYLNNQYAQSIAMYQKALVCSPELIKIRYCKSIVEGISLHAKQKFDEAANKFYEAYLIQNTVQSLFLSCISLIQKFKTTREEQTAVFSRVEELLQMGRQLDPKFALFLFYSSLVLLFEGKKCLGVIQAAINACQEPISEYFFIQALALQAEGKLSLSLEAISRAIELDPGIEEFYRERSKYYFMSEDYQSAIEDCKKAEEMAQDDQELPLLLSFYYYLNDEFIKSYNYLLRTKPSSGKLKEFEQALHLRLGLYDKLGEIGKLLMAIRQEEPVDERLLIPLETYIAERYQFSEFSVYFYHLLLAIGYASMREVQKSLNHLFGCLEEIQCLVDERESKQSAYEVTWEETEEMLDEIKFNIVVVSLMKENYEETKHFISVFLSETESEDLKETFNRITALISDESLEGEVKLMAEDDYPRISDRFPALRIKLRKQTLITKLLMSYPVKLKFTITPQFDPAYLLNFDFDKVEYRVPPPWLKSSAKKATFTNSIRNQSILLSESQASQRKDSNKSIPVSIREKLKLDKDVEQKLKKIIQK